MKVILYESGDGLGLPLVPSAIPRLVVLTGDDGASAVEHSLCPSFPNNSLHLCLHLSISSTIIITNGFTVHCWDLGLFFSFLFPYTVGRAFWTGDQPDARPLATQRTASTKNTNIHASSGIRTRDLSAERAKTVRASGRSAPLIGLFLRPRL
jgi:hypothetical protein